MLIHPRKLESLIGILYCGPSILIKARITNGTIQPLAPLPEDWTEGSEITIERVSDSASFDWAKEVEEAMSGISTEDHKRLLDAISEHRSEAEEQMRIEMEQ
ncbi:MAG: hypothetical protein O3B01_30755 [Planctomycetota bacterium]|nr:hypothetical protein [Planctomycetota bacterium]